MGMLRGIYSKYLSGLALLARIGISIIGIRMR